jgi:hypothetical protein
MELLEVPKSLYTVMHGMGIVYSGRWMLVGKKNSWQGLFVGKANFTPPNNSLCPFNSLNKILTQFTTPNNSSWCNLLPIEVLFLFLSI